MPARIIVPLDGSKFSEDALATALAVLDESGSVELVTAVEGAPPFSVPDYDVLAKEWAMTYLDGLKEKLPPALDAKSQVMVGHPPEQIRLFIEDSDADLVVMSTHGRGPVTRAWLGSMADFLVRTSRVPLLLIHPQEEDEPSYQADLPPKKILVPLDGSDLAATAAGGSMVVFGPDIDLTLLRVVQNPPSFGSPYLPDTVKGNEELASDTAQAKDDLTATAQKYAATSRSVKAEVIASDHVGKAIVDFAESNGFDAIAVATHGRGGVGRLALGSVADKIIRSARIPVLTFRP